MQTERHEILAWLGDDHGLTGEQVEELERIADEIRARYCTPDSDVNDPEEVLTDLLAATSEERDAALVMAYRLMSGDEAAVDEAAEQLLNARRTIGLTLAALEQAARLVVEPSAQGRHNPRSESGFAARAGVDRMTVRKWLGKR